MDMVTKHCALLLALVMAATPLAAEELAPNLLLQAVTKDVLAAMKQDKAQHAGVSPQVARVIETQVLPLFDFPRMTQMAMARNWRSASPEQQKTLTGEFRTLLVHTYSSALSSYRDKEIEFRNLAAPSTEADVTVKSVVKQSGTAPVSIDYDMEKTPAGWKVYDIKVAGVSLVTTYRDSFSERIRDDGVAGLIRSLEEKNHQGETLGRAPGT